MLKIIITLTTLLLSMLSSAQNQEKFLHANILVDIRGRDCHGGSGLCSVMPSESNKSDSNHGRVIKQSSNTIALIFDANELSVEEQKIHFGAVFSKSASSEKLYFIQETDFVFDESQLMKLEIDSKYNLVKKGTYPMQIQNNQLQVIIPLSIP